jgi:adenine-specific DNA-methyltransferase
VTTQNGFKPDAGWVILSELEANIKSKIELVGTPLKDWDIAINRGVLTGYNEAFIIDKDKRDQLIMNCPEADEIIRPILRGRDIKRYNVQFANQWIINTHNGIKQVGIEPINSERDYPVIFEHLNNYKNLLIKRFDQGNHWSNLRNCAYIEDFDKEKIVWIELTDRPNFALDNSGFYLNNTIFFMTGKHLKYLLAFLNSRICEWYFDKIAATSGAGTRRWIKMYIDQICIPLPTEMNESRICTMVDQLNSKFSLDVYHKLEDEIYSMFELSTEEVELLVNAAL